MTRTHRAASAALSIFLALPLHAQAGKSVKVKTPVPTPKPAGSGPIQVQPGIAAPPSGAKQADVLPGTGTGDPYEMERLGFAAINANELIRAREFFQKSWDLGELPTAAYNLACVDAREGRSENAIKQLQKAVSVGFDDEATLLNDADLGNVKKLPAFASIVAGVKKNRETGDASVVKEGLFLAPPGPAGAILILLHDAPSDPLTVSGPFADEARARSLYLAVPRGPARAGHRRFGWGTPDRAFAAVEATLAEARKRAGGAQVPAVLVGVGRGGTLALSAAARKPKTFFAVGSIGGPLDPVMARGLAGSRVFLGVAREAPPSLVTAVQRGRDLLAGAGVMVGHAEWPGTGTSFPNDVRQAVLDTLDGLVGPKR